MKPKVYAVDIDGTLTKGTAWTEQDCLDAVPNLEAIKVVNKLHDTNFIVIHTARRHRLYGATIEWLNRNNVQYHAVRFQKMPCDVIVDFDAVNSVERLKQNGNT